jgi:hypothetical protein
VVCIHVDHWESTSGVIGLRGATSCDCVDGKSETGDRKRAAAEAEKESARRLQEEFSNHPTIRKLYDSDTKRVEYDEDFEVQGVRVYLIDDGEQHWYVAKSMIDALKTHENLDGNEDQNDVTISVIKPDKLLTRTESDGIQETFPETFEIDRTEDQEFSRGPKVTTTAAEWANFYGKQAPTQIMSSVF